MCTLHTYTYTISYEYTHIYNLLEHVGIAGKACIDSPQLFQVVPVLWVSNHKFYTWLLQIHPPSLWHSTTKITTEDIRRQACNYLSTKAQLWEMSKNVQTRRINFSFSWPNNDNVPWPNLWCSSTPSNSAVFWRQLCGNEGHNPPHRSNPCQLDWLNRAWSLLAKIFWVCGEFTRNSWSAMIYFNCTAGWCMPIIFIIISSGLVFMFCCEW